MDINPSFYVIGAFWLLTMVVVYFVLNWGKEDGDVSAASALVATIGGLGGILLGIKGTMQLVNEHGTTATLYLVSVCILFSLWAIIFVCRHESKVAKSPNRIR